MGNSPESQLSPILDSLAQVVALQRQCTLELRIAKLNALTFQALPSLVDSLGSTIDALIAMAKDAGATDEQVQQAMGSTRVPA